jgi:nitrate/nitrite transporter NarK
LFLILGSSLRFLGGYSIGFWSPEYFIGKFADDESVYSVLNTIIWGAGGFAASFTGGILADKYKDKRGWILAACHAIALGPFILAFSVANNFYLSMSLYTLSYLFSEMWIGPCVSMF